MDDIFKKVERGIEGLFGGEKHSHTHGEECAESHDETLTNNRYQSFAPQSSGHAKWYVDGCSYFWAVSEALESKSGVQPRPITPRPRKAAAKNRVN